MAESQEKVDGYENEAVFQTTSPSPAASLCVQCKETISRESQTLLTSCCGHHYCLVCVSSELQEKRQCRKCGQSGVKYEPSSLKHKIEQFMLKENGGCSVKENGHTEEEGVGGTTTPELSHREDTESNDGGRTLSEHELTDQSTGNTESIATEVVLEECTGNADSGIEIQHTSSSCEQQGEEQSGKEHIESQFTEQDHLHQPKNTLKDDYNTYMGSEHHSRECLEVDAQAKPTLGEATPCSNQCGVSCGLSSVEEHLKICPLQETLCEFNVIGCMETFPRKHQESHMLEHTQTHLGFMASTIAAMQELQHKQLEIFDQKLQQKHLETEQRLKTQQEDFEASMYQQQDRFKRLLKQQQSDFEQKLKEEREKRSHLETMLHAKERHIQENTAIMNRLQEQLNTVVLQSPPYRFKMTNFKQLKMESRAWNSLPMYTHPGGYKVCVRVRPNGLPWSRGFKTHMSVWFFAVKGDYDEGLVWPAEATITLQLLNQYHDKKHLTVTRRYLWRKDVVDTSNHTALGVILDKLISHEGLELNSQEETLYLKENCLQFRITEIIVHS